jgi:hypothetical protein
MPRTPRPPVAKPKLQPVTDLKARRNQDAASKAQIEADRLEAIVRLRSARTPWRDVGKQVGLNHETCRKLMLAEMARRAEVNGENLDRHREEMAETIDLLLRLAVRDAVGAQSIVERAQATPQASRLLRQWADLYGLNAPKRLEAKIDVTHVSPIDEELARLAEQLGLDAPVGD